MKLSSFLTIFVLFYFVTTTKPQNTAPSQAVQAIPNPDGSYLINGVRYVAQQQQQQPPRAAFQNPNNPAASGPGCICDGPVCSNCAVG